MDSQMNNFIDMVYNRMIMVKNFFITGIQYQLTYLDTSFEQERQYEQQLNTLLKSFNVDRSIIENHFTTCTELELMPFSLIVECQFNYFKQWCVPENQHILYDEVFKAIKKFEFPVL